DVVLERLDADQLGRDLDRVVAGGAGLARPHLEGDVIGGGHALLAEVDHRAEDAAGVGGLGGQGEGLALLGRLDRCVGRGRWIVVGRRLGGGSSGSGLGGRRGGLGGGAGVGGGSGGSGRGSGSGAGSGGSGRGGRAFEGLAGLLVDLLLRWRRRLLLFL